MPITPELIGSFVSGVVGPVALFYIKHLIEKRKEEKEKQKSDPVKESIKSNILIDNKIHQILGDFDADRVWILQFHNGGNFYPTGKSIHKFSMFYEAVSKHTFAIREYFQNIPVSLFSRSINHLVDDDYLKIPDFNASGADDYGLKYIAYEYDSKSTYLFSIRAIDDKFVGVLGIDYVKKKRNLSDDEINDLRIEVTSIGGELPNHLTHNLPKK